LSFMRFLGLGLADAVPDANTIWTFREALKKANAADVLFEQFDAALREAGFLAMSGQIVDATIVAAPKQRNTNGEKQAIKDGRIPEGWKDKPAKLAQKDRDARWTVKYTKAKVREDGSLPPVDLAIPAFGYKNHVSIDRAHGLIRKWTATHAAALVIGFGALQGVSRGWVRAPAGDLCPLERLRVVGERNWDERLALTASGVAAPGRRAQVPTCASGRHRPGRCAHRGSTRRHRTPGS